MFSVLISQLEEFVKSQPDFKKSEVCYVSIYRYYQRYGGPEEGGWWYDRFQLLGGKPFLSIEDAEAWLEKAKLEIERKNQEEIPQRAKAYANLPDEDKEPCPANCPEGYIPLGWDDGGELEILVEVEERYGQRDNMNEPCPHYE